MAKVKKSKVEEVTSIDNDEQSTLLGYSEDALRKYGSYVIENRALADIRDGLKPVHRRILWSMHKLNLKSNGPFKKSARVVGELIGLYHPHGDASGYQALVGMAGVRPKGEKDSWLRKNVNEPMIEGRGNFGDHVDGPAAQRYCLVAGTRVATERGLIEIDEMPNWENVKEAYKALSTDSFTKELNLKVTTATGEDTATKWINSGKHTVYELTTEEGYSITCTANHPFLVHNDSLDYEWKELKHLKVNDTVCIHRNNKLFPRGGKRLTEKLSMSEDLAYILGVLSCFNENVEKVDFKGNSFYEPFLKCWEKESFPIDLTKDFFLVTDELKTIHREGILYHIQRSSQEEVQAFLRGIFDVCGSTYIKQGVLGFSFQDTSKVSLKNIQQLLLNFMGVVSSLNNNTLTIEDYISTKKFWQVAVKCSFLNKNVKEIIEEIIEEVTEKNYNTNKELDSYVIKNRKFEKLKQVEEDYYYAKIKSIVEGTKKWVYDITVGEDHSFLAEGFIVHNTECKLSKYGEDYFLDPDYLSVSDMVPNFSDDYMEPVILPSKIPNLLINGSEGIAVGVSSHIPSFKRESVLKLAKLALEEKLSNKLVLKTLSGNFSFPYGGLAIDEEGLETLITDGVGAITFTPSSKMESNSLVLTSYSPRFNFIKFKEKALQVKNTASIRNETGDEGIRIVITPNKNITKKMLEVWASKILELTESRITFRMSATIRNPDGSVSFRNTSINDVLQTWKEFRIDIEKRVIKYKATNLKKERNRLKVLLKAIDHIDFIIKTLRTKGKGKVTVTINEKEIVVPWAKRELMNKLKLTLDEVEIIMEMKLRSLEALEQESMTNKLKEINKEIKVLKSDYKNPAPRILKDFN